MFIFEIITPGTWLEFEDNDARMRIDDLIRNLKSQFFEANTALNLYIEQRERAGNKPEMPDHGALYERQRQIEDSFGANRWPPPSYEERQEISFGAEVMAKKELWAKGHLPFALESVKVFIFARAFIYALDSFDKFLHALCEEVGLQQSVRDCRREIATAFPDLRGVRNSAHHPEDRTRGLGTGGKVIDLKPVNNELVRGEGVKLLAMNCLIGNRYGATMADGHYGEVEVSPDSMQKLQAILEKVLQGFKWSGAKQHEPRW